MSAFNDGFGSGFDDLDLDIEIRIDDLPDSTGGDFELLPPGDYEAVIAKAELKPTKDGTGQYINLRYDITGPSHQGRVVFGMINIRNKSPKAMEIGLGQLKQLMQAIGLQALKSTQQLVGAQLKIKIGVQPEKDGFPAKNDVKAWKPISGAASAFPTSAPAAAHTAAPAAQPRQAQAPAPVQYQAQQSAPQAPPAPPASAYEQEARAAQSAAPAAGSAPPWLQGR